MAPEAKTIAAAANSNIFTFQVSCLITLINDFILKYFTLIFVVHKKFLGKSVFFM